MKSLGIAGAGNSLPRTRVGTGIRAAAMAVAALALAHCAAPVSVRTVRPAPPAGMAAVAARPGLGDWLEQVDHAYRRLARGDAAAAAAYNFAVARLVGELERRGADPWTAPIDVAEPGGPRRLAGRAPDGFDPRQFELRPADSLSFHGKDARRRPIVPGVGAPLVAVADRKTPGHGPLQRIKRPVRNLTAVVRFKGPTATLELLDPWQAESVVLGGRRHELAADFGATPLFALAEYRIDKLGLARLLRPSRYDDTARLSFLQPYDERRIPVLFVHGLQSTPATFAALYFELLDDPELRRHCQFWAFSYPSGYAYPYSAKLLRDQLAAVRREFPGHRDIVIVGHSMGSLISRLMVTESGGRLWHGLIGRPAGETGLRGRSAELIKECLIFDDCDGIGRVVFIAAPHRGAEIASNWIGRLVSRMIRLPDFVADVRNHLLSVALIDPAGLAIARIPNSIDTLSPENPFLQEINRIPMVPGLEFHSIIGDRGRGDTPESSDGIVPYWSSHLDGAVSEKIVPSGHNAHQHPEGIREVHRILREHMRTR